MFEQLELAAPDAILGITEAFQKDSNPDKINLSVGVYKDAQGTTPILDTVREAESRILHEQKTKGYFPITGSSEYGQHVQNMLFGREHAIVQEARAVTAHTPGGTGALRVAANFISEHFPGASIWLSEPTWPNHPNIFAAAGVPVKTYPYFDKSTNGLAWQAMRDAVDKIPAGDVLLLHGCCHNPTGIDLAADQWAELAERCAAGKILPLVDFAYQGFATGIEEDAAGLRSLASRSAEMIVCNSYSKNFGLYCERVGAISLVSSDNRVAEKAASQLKKGIRSNYSNPPAHGALIITTILSDDVLRAAWETELAAMRDRIHGMRTLFVQTLAAKGVPGDFSFIEKQHGMFSFSGLTPEQVQTLRDDHSIYIVGSGRINVAGMTEQNMDTLCTAIATVTKDQ